jgi:crotonobetainyl-CoA:carnitine CoA-transferase CaiB-like acyl-CoA transferase
MQRDGNRAPHAAPQGLYPCAGSEPGATRWLALSVASDAQWEALKTVLGRPAWAEDPKLGSLRGRRADHDAIDAELRRWFETREREDCSEQLLAAGVPAVPLADPRFASANPQMAARGFYESFDHAVVGRHAVPTVPFRYASVDRWVRAPAPRLGEHNHEVLGGILGLDAAALDALEEEGVIGTRPPGLES